jgi:hypothetical protein
MVIVKENQTNEKHILYRVDRLMSEHLSFLENLNPMTLLLCLSNSKSSFSSWSCHTNNHLDHSK